MSWSIGAGLEGKGVIVTGAAGGIGREIALAFAKAGCHVAAMDINEKGVSEIAALMEGGRHLAMAVDLRDIAGHEALIAKVQKQFGRLDVLANTAAILIRRANIDEVTEEDWDLQHDINLKAGFFLNRAFARALKAQGRGGRMINFTSQGWWSGGFGGSVIYAASKGGVVSMTRGLARSYAKDRITVNAVSPGAADTSMLRTGLTEEQLNFQIAQIPMGYMAPPSDLAGTVLLLASDHASYITGATINVSGGWLMY